MEQTREEFEESKRDIEEVYRSMTMAFLKKDNENEKIYIYFISKEKFNKDDLKQRVKHSKDNGATNVIFVLHGSTNLVMRV